MENCGFQFHDYGPYQSYLKTLSNSSSIFLSNEFKRFRNSFLYSYFVSINKSEKYIGDNFGVLLDPLKNLCYNVHQLNNRTSRRYTLSVPAV